MHFYSGPPMHIYSGVDNDVLFARLKQHYTEAQIVELAGAIALENFRSKFNPALGVEAQGFCVIPETLDRMRR
jgi:hypothetical protein